MSKPFPYRGYIVHPDGTYRKTVEFVSRYGGEDFTHCRETLVRQADGKLLQVLRTKRQRRK